MKNWIIIGAFLAAVAVLFGAFGAHLLKSRLPTEYLNTFETGVRYQMYHDLGIISLGILGFHYDENVIHLPAVLLTFGIIIFSGSLYLLVLTDIRLFGALTPIGGASFIVGWIILIMKIRAA